jgi:1-acyl-sn-glycerol-3-phosphate acyltransferase
MDKFLVRTIQFFTNRKLFFVIFLAFLGAVIAIGISQLKLTDSIFSVFPKTPESEQFAKIVKENKLNKKIFFSIKVNDAFSINNIDLLDSISTSIKEATDDYLFDFETNFGNNEEQIFNLYYDQFPIFLVDSDYVDLKQQISKDSISKRVSSIKNQLASADGLFLRKYFSKDPLGFTWSKLSSLSKKLDSSQFTIDEGVLISKDRDNVFFTAKTKYGINSGNKNIELEDLLNQLKVDLNNQGIELDYFSPFLIANANSKQIKIDSNFVMLLAVILILIILLIYYRSLLIPLLFFIPVIFSASLSIAIIGLMGIEISLISLAISAILLGIVMDYSFHFFTHYSETLDVNTTIKDIFKPMIIGSFTTIAAFAALLFTNSTILQDFGLMALLTLSIALICTLIFLPIIINILGIKPKARTTTSSFQLPKWVAKIALILTLVLSVLFIIQQPTIQFDADLNNLSYHPKHLIELEKTYTGLNPEKEKKLMLFTSADNIEDALKYNSQLYQKLLEFQTDTLISEVISIAPYLTSKEQFDQKNKQWNRFWQHEKDSTSKFLSEAAIKQGLSSKSFQPFINWINDPIQYDLATSQEALELMGLEDFIEISDTSIQLITSITVPKSKLEGIKTEIRNIPNVYIFDVSEMAFSLINSVQADFGYLLLFSSLLVFLSLLVIYGRIELALFSFFPMAVSWVWIIYLANFFSIQFNFVNIILATIIFGLGDDFSIFITDGLIQEYKTKSKSIKSYTSAILLSAITTIVGTGVLIFAKHPAINSIAILSVSGIASILLVTLIVQPLIFKTFVTKRVNKRYSPMTALGTLVTAILYSYFMFGCLLLNIIIFFLLFIPIKKTKKQHFVTFLISKMAASTLYIGFHIKKKIHHRERLDFSKPAIFVANHVSFLDILMTLKLNPKMIIVVNEWVYKSPLFGFVVRYSGYIYIKDNPVENLHLVKNRIKEGYSIMVFPEGTRNPSGKIQRFKKGAFYLAQELNLDIQPVIFTGTELVNPKGDLIIKNGKLSTHILERISTTDPLYSETPRIMSKEINRRMRIAMEECKKIDYDTTFMGQRILTNYIYKGPILEWYFRIKWMLEKKNFEYYDSIIQDRKKIYDLGCGYGYLSFYLHYRNANRQIIGVDYDESKIEVAHNCYDKGPELNFYYENIKNHSISNADVIILTDVLHYIKKEERTLLFEKLNQNLNSGGMIIIRDGVSDLENKHQKTLKSERYSTKYIKFNKVENELEFISLDEIKLISELYNFTFEIKGESKSMSNIMMILRKN